MLHAAYKIWSQNEIVIWLVLHHVTKCYEGTLCLVPGAWRLVGEKGFEDFREAALGDWQPTNDAANEIMLRCKIKELASLVDCLARFNGDAGIHISTVTGPEIAPQTVVGYPSELFVGIFPEVSVRIKRHRIVL